MGENLQMVSMSAACVARGHVCFLRRDDYIYGTRSFYYNDRKLSILFQRISQDITNISNLELQSKSLTTKVVKKDFLNILFLSFGCDSKKVTGKD